MDDIKTLLHLLSILVYQGYKRVTTTLMLKGKERIPLIANQIRQNFPWGHPDLYYLLRVSKGKYIFNL